MLAYCPTITMADTLSGTRCSAERGGMAMLQLGSRARICADTRVRRLVRLDLHRGAIDAGAATNHGGAGSPAAAPKGRGVRRIAAGRHRGGRGTSARMSVA